jgi:hypothetical protein
MLSLVSSPSPIRPVSSTKLIAPPLPSETCYGVPSCGPLVQHELLKAVREQLPQAYARASRELGLTVTRTQELIERRAQIISAARAIKLARMIAYEPNSRDVFGQAGSNLFTALQQQTSGALKATVRALPRPLRFRLALAWTRRIAHGFAGSVNQITYEARPGGIVLSVQQGVFADRLDTLGGAHAYYQRILTTMLHEFAHVDCEISELRRPRVSLNQCNYKIVWEA